MSLIIVIVKIVRIVIRNVVTEIHDCYLLLVRGDGVEPPLIVLIGCAPLITYRCDNLPKSPHILTDGGDNHSNLNQILWKTHSNINYLFCPLVRYQRQTGRCP